MRLQETVSTLSYAQRASGIKNRPVQNQLLSSTGRSISPVPGSMGGGGGGTQEWADMELRLSYMETQVRPSNHSQRNLPMPFNYFTNI